MVWVRVGRMEEFRDEKYMHVFCVIGFVRVDTSSSMS